MIKTNKNENLFKKKMSKILINLFIVMTLMNHQIIQKNNYLWLKTKILIIIIYRMIITNIKCKVFNMLKLIN